MDRSSSLKVGGWLVEPDLDRISQNGDRRSLRPLVMDLLVYLSRRDGQVASIEDIVSDVWPGKFITDATVYKPMHRPQWVRCHLSTAVARITHEELEILARSGRQRVLFVAGITRAKAGRRLGDATTWKLCLADT